MSDDYLRDEELDGLESQLGRLAMSSTDHVTVHNCVLAMAVAELRASRSRLAAVELSEKDRDALKHGRALLATHLDRFSIHDSADYRFQESYRGGHAALSVLDRLTAIDSLAAGDGT